MKYAKIEKHLLEFTAKEIIDFNDFYSELDKKFLNKYDKIMVKIYYALPPTDYLE